MPSVSACEAAGRNAAAGASQSLGAAPEAERCKRNKLKQLERAKLNIKNKTFKPKANHTNITYNAP